jgi:hypothetical protein
MSQDFWLLPTKFQLTTLTRLNRSPLSIPIVYVVSVRQLVLSAVNQSLVVALLIETFGLRQCCASWSAELTASPSPVHSSRSPAYTSLISFHRHSRQVSLAAINSANSVQAGDHRSPVTARHGTALSYLLPAQHLHLRHRPKNTIPNVSFLQITVVIQGLEPKGMMGL